MVCFNPAFFTLGRTVHSRQPFTYQRATTTDPSEMKQGPLSKPALHQKEPPGLPLHPRPSVRGNCLQQLPLPSSLLESVWDSSSRACGAGLIPLQPGRMPWSLNRLNRSPTNMLGIFQEANRVQRGNRKLCLQSRGQVQAGVCLRLIRVLQRPRGSPLGVTFLVLVLKSLQLTSELTLWSLKACGRRHQRHSFGRLADMFRKLNKVSVSLQRK